MNYRIVRKDELYHYGVPGMRWGIRKQREVIGRQRRSVDDHYRAEVRRRRIQTAKMVGLSVATIALTAYGGYTTLRWVNSPAFRRGAVKVAKMLAKGDAFKTASYAQRINVGADALAKASLVGSLGKVIYDEGRPYVNSARSYINNKRQTRLRS